jgi:hypothetical protein
MPGRSPRGQPETPNGVGRTHTNGVIDAQKEFAERRYRAEAGHRFEKIKANAMRQYGVNIECCRETYFNAAERLFAVVGDLLVETYSNPPRLEPWAEAKRRLGQAEPAAS